MEDRVGKEKVVRQGIIHSGSCTENCINLRINAKDGSASNTRDDAIASAYGDKFIIHLNSEILDSAISYY